MTKETEALIQMVEFFTYSGENKCWPTTKRWTLAEAKETLRKAAAKARDAEAAR